MYLTLQVKHTRTHTHTHWAALFSPGGSKVVISLFQILIWQQLQPVARLPPGRQSPFKSFLLIHPTTHQHQSCTPTTILCCHPSQPCFYLPSLEGLYPPLPHPLCYPPVWLWLWHQAEFTRSSRWQTHGYFRINWERWTLCSSAVTVHQAPCCMFSLVFSGKGSLTVNNPVLRSWGMCAKWVCFRTGQQTGGLVAAGGCGQSLCSMQMRGNDGEIGSLMSERTFIFFLSCFSLSTTGCWMEVHCVKLDGESWVLTLNKRSWGLRGRGERM